MLQVCFPISVSEAGCWEASLEMRGGLILQNSYQLGLVAELARVEKNHQAVEVIESECIKCSRDEGCQCYQVLEEIE